jgi:TRAP-type C4-dicarboxylate transport system substrate-binding protein
VWVFVAAALKRAPHLYVSVHPNLSLKIGAVEQLDAMLRGQIEMSVYPLSYAIDRIPEFMIGTFPFVPADLDMAIRLKGTLFHKRLQSLAEDNGIHILTWWWMPSGIASRAREFAGPETIKGLNIGTPDAGFDRLFETVSGRRVQLIPSEQVGDALRSGKIDTVVTSLASLLALRIQDQTKFVTFGGLGSFMSFQPLVISKLAWDGLTVDEQIALEEAAALSDEYFESSQRAIERRAKEAFAKAGVQIRELNFAEYEAWSVLAKQKIWPEFRKVSPTADGLFVSLLTSLARPGQGAR